MGIFKQIKEMKDMVHAAPGMINQANQMSANAQGMAAAQQQAGNQQAAAAQAAAASVQQAQPSALEAIAGVSLQQYAVIVKAIAPLNYDQSALPGIAASHGIDSSSWQRAHDGWNARIQGDPAVARAFSDIYRGV